MTLAERPKPLFSEDEGDLRVAEVVDWVPQNSLSSAQVPPPRDTTVQPYDPERIRQQYQGQWLLVAQRWFAILFPFVSFVFFRWWDAKTDKAHKKERSRAVALREMLTNLGPAFIKIGQALSTMWIFMRWKPASTISWCRK